MPVHDLQFATFLGANYIDLMLFQYGREMCEPGHAFGPAQRSHYLFHYIISGKGTLLATDDSGEKHRFDLGAGEGFLIFPGQMNIYFADIEDPWEYTWVEFDGAAVKRAIKQTGLTTSSPVYRSQSADLHAALEREMRYLVDHREESELHLMAHGYLFLDNLIRSIEPAPVPAANKLQDFYISKAIAYIENNYQNDITVEDIARQTGLNRSYFGKMFRSAVDRSPQQYLIAYRMNKATELLKLSALSVGEVGKAVGYPNQLHFSRAFKNVYGVSPRTWRKENMGVTPTGLR